MKCSDCGKEMDVVYSSDSNELVVHQCVNCKGNATSNDNLRRNVK